MSFDDTAKNVLISGYLKLFYKTTWKKRYCVLNESTLVYSKNSKKNRKWKSIQLSSVDEIVLKSFTVLYVKTFNKEYKFKSDAPTITEWMTALNEVTSVLNTYSSFQSFSTNGFSFAIKKDGHVPRGKRNSKKTKLSAHTVSRKNSMKLNNEVCLEDFEIIKIVGIGSFGTVYLSKFLRETDSDSGNEKVYAMKVLNKDDIRLRGKIERTKTELVVLKHLNNPFLIKLHYAFNTRDSLYLITDFVNGGELFFHLERCGRFEEDRAKFYAAEMSIGLDYLHNNNIIYRDLKPENVLIDNSGHIVMTDFGLSKELKENDTTTSMCGTPEYLAPEIIHGLPYNKSVDWWALGMILFEMLAGSPPFEQELLPVLYDEILHEDIIFPVTMSPDAREVIAALAEKNVDNRINSLDMLKTYQFFMSIDWDKLSHRAVVPPYIPDLTDKYDLTNIDSEYLELSLESFNDANSFESDTFDDFQYAKRNRNLTY